MNIFQAIILGIIEGITEFLPISSTGHLVIAQKILGLQNINEFFTVVIQLGAILASVYFFRDKIKEILHSFFTLKNKNFSLKKANQNERLLVWIIISMIPALFFGFLFRHKISDLENSALAIACTTIFFGIVFYIIEIIAKKYREHKSLDINTVSFFNIILMGLFQAVALIPGVSRSGSTIPGGISQNIKMHDSIEISFLMGIPLIFLATVYKILSTFSSVSFEIVVMTIIGSIISFLVGLYSIQLTLGILSKKGFFPFMIYRIGLGVIILFLIFSGFIK